jgi:cation transport ATPase
VETLGPADLGMVGPGEVAPTDGTLIRAVVLDESALTGESLPVERAAGEPVQSGVVNAGSPSTCAPPPAPPRAPTPA